MALGVGLVREAGWIGGYYTGVSFFPSVWFHLFFVLCVLFRVRKEWELGGVCVSLYGSRWKYAYGMGGKGLGKGDGAVREGF